MPAPHGELPSNCANPGVDCRLMPIGARAETAMTL